MPMYEVRLSLRVSGEPDRAAHFEAVTDAFAELEDVHDDVLDSSFGFANSDDFAEMDVEVSVTAADEAQAYQLASSCVRSAIQTAGGHTPGWEHLPSSGAVYRLTDESVDLVATSV